jgi:hypothetical protein
MCEVYSDSQILTELGLTDNPKHHAYNCCRLNDGYECCAYKIKNGSVIVDQLIIKKECDKVVRLVELGIRLSSFNITTALQCDEVKMAKFLLLNKCPLSATCLDMAIKKNESDLIDSMLDMNCPIASSNIHTAIIMDNIDLVDELMKRGCPLSSLCLKAAIGKKNKNLINFFLAKDCPIDKHCLLEAFDSQDRFLFTTLLDKAEKLGHLVDEVDKDN